MLLGLVPECIEALSKAPGPQDRVRDWKELPPEAAGVVVEVGGTRTGQCRPGDFPGIHTEPDSRAARPRPRAHGRNHRPPQVAGHPMCPS